MNWQPLGKWFWASRGRTKTGLPPGHIVSQRVGQIIYLKIGGKVYKSASSKNPWREVTDSLELTALGEKPA